MLMVHVEMLRYPREKFTLTSYHAPVQLDSSQTKQQDAVVCVIQSLASLSQYATKRTEHLKELEPSGLISSTQKNLIVKWNI